MWPGLQHRLNRAVGITTIVQIRDGPQTPWPGFFLNLPIRVLPQTLYAGQQVQVRAGCRRLLLGYGRVRTNYRQVPRWQNREPRKLS